MFTAKKRFIAGAVCPRCGKMDKLVVYREQERDYRECVSCGFRDEMRFPPQVREPETRVNRLPEDKDVETRPITLLPDSDTTKRGKN